MIITVIQAVRDQDGATAMVMGAAMQDLAEAEAEEMDAAIVEAMGEEGVVRGGGNGRCDRQAKKNGARRRFFMPV
jgi:hypothetical protein